MTTTIGAAKFNAIIGNFYRRNADHGGSTEYLVNALRQASAPEVKLLVDDWIYTTAWTERVEQVASVEELTAYYRGHARE